MNKSWYRELDPFPSNLVALIEIIVCVKYFGLFFNEERIRRHS